MDRMPAEAQPTTDIARTRQLTLSAHARQAETEQAEFVARDSDFICHNKGQAVPAWRQGLWMAHVQE